MLLGAPVDLQAIITVNSRCRSHPLLQPLTLLTRQAASSACKQGHKRPLSKSTRALLPVPLAWTLHIHPDGVNAVGVASLRW